MKFIRKKKYDYGELNQNIKEKKKPKGLSLC